MERNEKPLTVLATIGLLVVTGGLAYFTAGLWFQTKRLAQDAFDNAQAAKDDNANIRRIMSGQQEAMIKQAVAAQRLATASMASERAVVLVDVPNSRESSNGIRLDQAAPFKIVFMNLGRTYAWVDHFEAIFHAWDDTSIIGQMNAHDRGVVSTVGAWLGPGASTNSYVIRPKSQVEMRLAWGGKATAVVSGQVRFRDVFGTNHETGFAYKWGVDNSLAPIPGALNYTRIIGQNEGGDGDMTPTD
jgi:hypothetical protein